MESLKMSPNAPYYLGKIFYYILQENYIKAAQDTLQNPLLKLFQDCQMGDHFGSGMIQPSLDISHPRTKDRFTSKELDIDSPFKFNPDMLNVNPEIKKEEYQNWLKRVSVPYRPTGTLVNGSITTQDDGTIIYRPVQVIQENEQPRIFEIKLRQFGLGMKREQVIAELEAMNQFLYNQFQYNAQFERFKEKYPQLVRRRPVSNDYSILNIPKDELYDFILRQPPPTLWSELGRLAAGKPSKHAPITPFIQERHSYLRLTRLWTILGENEQIRDTLVDRIRAFNYHGMNFRNERYGDIQFHTIPTTAIPAMGWTSLEHPEPGLNALVPGLHLEIPQVKQLSWITELLRPLAYIHEEEHRSNIPKNYELTRSNAIDYREISELFAYMHAFIYSAAATKYALRHIDWNSVPPNEREKYQRIVTTITPYLNEIASLHDPRLFSANGSESLLGLVAKDKEYKTRFLDYISEKFKKWVEINNRKFNAK